MQKIKRKLLLIIFTFAIILRLAYVLAYPQMPLLNDPAGYDKTGWGLVNGSGFPVFTLDNEVIISRPPGYPLFLAAIYVVFGHNITAVRMVQALIDALVCLMILYLGSRLFNPLVGYTGASAYVFYFPPVLFTGMLYTESFYTFIFGLSILFLLLALNKDQLKYWVACGVFLGLATLISTRSLYFILFAAIAVFLNNRSLFKSIKRIAVIILCMLILFAPWTARNYNKTGKFILLDNIGSSGASLLWLATNPYGVIDWNMSADPMKSRFAHLSEEEMVRIFKKEAFVNLKQYPFAYVRNSLKRFGLFWFSSFSYHIYGFEKSFSALWQERNLMFLFLKLFLFGLNALFVMLGVFGIWASLRIWKRTYFIILAPIIYFTLIDTLYVVTPRHQVPIIPFMMIFASVGLIYVIAPRRVRE